MTDLPQGSNESVAHDSLPNESLSLISLSNPFYGDILVYLQTHLFWPELSKDNRPCIHHKASQYLVVGDVLYHQSVDIVL